MFRRGLPFVAWAAMAFIPACGAGEHEAVSNLEVTSDAVASTLETIPSLTLDRSHPYFESPNNLVPQMWKHHDRVFLSVRVDDNALRQALAPALESYDNQEEAFVEVPRETAAGVVEWERLPVPLSENFFGMASHFLTLDGPTLDTQACHKYGIAWGLKTNVGTVWLQRAGDNWPNTLHLPR